MPKRHLLAFLLVALPTYLCAHLTGTYEVSGFDPAVDQHYSGTVVIEKSNEHVFTAFWTFNDGSTNTGTGVKKHRSLSFVFNEPLTNTFGTQLYEIEDEHTLEGPWVRYEANERGFERLHKTNH